MHLAAESDSLEALNSLLEAKASYEAHGFVTLVFCQVLLF